MSPWTLDGSIGCDPVVQPHESMPIPPALLLALASVATAESEPPAILPDLFPFPNTTGILKTFNATGGVQSLQDALYSGGLHPL